MLFISLCLGPGTGLRKRRWALLYYEKSLRTLQVHLWVHQLTYISLWQGRSWALDSGLNSIPDGSLGSYVVLGKSLNYCKSQ